MGDAKLDSYLAAVAASMGEGRAEVQEALKLIKQQAPAGSSAQPLQLLALRRYLRLGGAQVVAQWAWTPEEQVRQLRDGTAKLLYQKAAEVQAEFRRLNPGYTLGITPLRSLARQVKLWNDNDTVQLAGRGLVKDMLAVLQTDYPEPPTGQSTSQFASRLRSAVVSPEPSNAAPGLSNHGRGTAVDFVVKRGNTVIADIKTEQIGPIWKKDGWEQKLIAAVGNRLKGPLPKPYEPWHWELP